VSPMIESPLMMLALLLAGIAMGALWCGWRERRWEREERRARFEALRRRSRVGGTWPLVDVPGRWNFPREMR